MSAKEELRLKVLGDYRAGKISRSEAALLLGVNWRTVSRWTAKLRTHGPKGVFHGNKGKCPGNKSSMAERSKILQLVESEYYDFNMTHCHEILVRDHELSVGYTTFRNWCREANIGKRKRRRPSKKRMARERMAMRGLMLQMDGSDHEWIKGQRWSLVGGIDDASSELPGINFYQRENTWSCMDVLRRVIDSEGIPVSAYVDQARWFGGLKAAERTQFARACDELGITLLPALSPQAKGRIERLWRTFQDRLIPELRRANVKTIEEANRYLHEVFLPKYWHALKTVAPRSDESQYRKKDRRLDLDQILCKKHARNITRDHTIHYGNVQYRLETPFQGSIAGKQAMVHEYENGTWAVYYGTTKLRVKRRLTRGLRHWRNVS